MDQNGLEHDQRALRGWFQAVRHWSDNAQVQQLLLHNDVNAHYISENRFARSFVDDVIDKSWMVHALELEGASRRIWKPCGFSPT